MRYYSIIVSAIAPLITLLVLVYSLGKFVSKLDAVESRLGAVEAQLSSIQGGLQLGRVDWATALVRLDMIEGRLRVLESKKE